MRIITIFLLSVFLPSGVFADVTASDITRALKKNIQHPYLYFTEEEKPALIERINNDTESREIMDRLLAEGNRLLYTPVEQYPPVRDKNPRYTGDNSYNHYIWNYRENAQILAFLYQMTGEQKYADKAWEFADVICDVSTWVDRAHDFPIIYNRIWPWNALDDEDQVMFNYDIRAGDTAYVMASVYDWLYPALNQYQRDRIRGALLEKAVLLVRGNYDDHWWASSYRCNWCGICFSGVGTASLALLNEDPQLADVIAESYNRMNLMFNELGVDGGWQEGRGYWAYGMRACIFYMEALKRVTNGKYDLYKHERVANKPVDFALYGLTGRFGDGSGAVVGSPHLINRLASETGNGTAAWYREHMLGKGDSMFDIIWPRPVEVAPVAPAEPSKHFRSIDWAVMRSDFLDNETVTVATKAGPHSDPHHGHLDVGNIIVTWRDHPFIREIGSIPYDQKCFDDERWDYPQASSAGHNVLFVNGELQISGKYKNTPWDLSVGGEILDFRTTGARDYTLIDGTNAYPKKEMKGWRRHIILEKPVITVMVDEVRCDAGDEIEARFHPDGETSQSGNDFTLINAKAGTMAVIPVSQDGLIIRPGRHGYLPVQANARFQWIPYFGTIVKAKSDITVLATVILPVDDESEARAVAGSITMAETSGGGITLSLVKDGQPHTFSFVKGKDGLVLK